MQKKKKKKKKRADEEEGAEEKKGGKRKVTLVLTCGPEHPGGPKIILKYAVSARKSFFFPFILQSMSPKPEAQRTQREVKKS